MGETTPKTAIFSFYSKLNCPRIEYSTKIDKISSPEKYRTLAELSLN